MAITATFKADFSSFTQAVDKAEVQLRSFETGAGKVEKALGRMTDTFSGRRVIQEATLTARAIEDIGGVSRLTENELARVGAQAQEAVAKLKAMGMEVPEGIQKVADATKNAGSAFTSLSGPLKMAGSLLGAFGIGLSVSAVVGFGKSLFDMAGQLEDLSAATGVSTDGLQKFAYVGTSVGVSMDEIGRAVGTLSERLAGGDKSASGAVEKLGLNIDALMRSGPEEAFISIGEAVGRIEDPMEKNAVAADLFGGKLSKTLIPLLGDLRQAMNDVPKDALITPQQLENADKFGEKLETLMIRMKAFAATQIFPARPLELQMPENATLEEKARILRDLGWAEKDNWAATELATAAAVKEQAAQREAAAALAERSKAAVGLVDGYRQGSDAVDEIHEAFNKFSEDLAAKNAAALKVYNANLQDVIDTATGYRAVLDGIDGAVVEGVKYYAQQGVELKRVADMYELTSVQSSAMATALKVEAESIASTSRLWAEYASIRSAQGSTATERQIADVQRWAAETAAAAQRAGTDTMAFYEALAADTTAKLSAISVDWAKINSELSTGTQAGLQEIADKAQATYQAALAHVGEFSDGAIQRFRDTADAAQLAANAFGTGFESASVRATAALQETVNQAAKAKAALDMMFAGDAVPTSESLSAAAMRPGSFLGFGGGTMQQGTTGFVSNLPWPARANGGPVSSGQPYMVGERGPELFTPSQSGFITPNGGGNSITVNISAGVFDRSTVAGLADQIGQELMRRVNRRLPSA